MINFNGVAQKQNGLQWVSLNSKKPAEKSAAQEAPLSKPMAQTPSAELLNVYFGGAKEALEIAKSSFSKARFESLNEVLTFDEYINEIYEQPQIIQTSAQRQFDMIMSEGTESTGRFDPIDGDEILSYNFFKNRGLVGQHVPIHRYVKALGANARGGQIGNRVNLIVGPVGSGKSFMLDIKKRGLEDWSKTEQGKLYALRWANIPEEVAEKLKLELEAHENTALQEVQDKLQDATKDVMKRLNEGKITVADAGKEAAGLRELADMAMGNNYAEVEGSENGFYVDEPMNTDPIYVLNNHKDRKVGEDKNGRAIYRSVREMVLEDLNDSPKAKELPYQLRLEGDLPPISDLVKQELRNYYAQAENNPNGEDVDALVQQHVQARRIVFDETQGIGVATYQPKDEKNQDSTELSGGIDFMKLLKYGDPTHPMARSYRGEMQKANRGEMHMEEGLKLQKEFQYDFLTVGQERKIKPKDGAQIYVDMVLDITTNEPEFEKLQKDPTMEALQIRFFATRFPYLKNYMTEKGIYEMHDIKNFRAKGGHVDPNALEIASMWAVASRLKGDARMQLTPFEKAEIYANEGKTIAGYDTSTEYITRLEESAGLDEGHTGVSPRIIQNSISNALSHQSVKETGVLTADLLLKSIRKELKVGTINEPKRVPEYLQLLDTAEDILAEKTTLDVMEAYYSSYGKQALVDALEQYRIQLLTWNRAPEGAKEHFMQDLEQHLGIAQDKIKPFRENLLDGLEASGDMLEVVKSDEDFYKALLTDWMKGEMIQFIQFTESADKLKPVLDKLASKGYSESSSRQVVSDVRDQLKAARVPEEQLITPEMLESLFNAETAK